MSRELNYTEGLCFGAIIALTGVMVVEAVLSVKSDLDLGYRSETAVMKEEGWTAIKVGGNILEIAGTDHSRSLGRRRKQEQDGLKEILQKCKVIGVDYIGEHIQITIEEGTTCQ